MNIIAALEYEKGVNKVIKGILSKRGRISLGKNKSINVMIQGQRILMKQDEWDRAIIVGRKKGLV